VGKRNARGGRSYRDVLQEMLKGPSRPTRAKNRVKEATTIAIIRVSKKREIGTRRTGREEKGKKKSLPSETRTGEEFPKAPRRRKPTTLPNKLGGKKEIPRPGGEKR